MNVPSFDTMCILSSRNEIHGQIPLACPLWSDKCETVQSAQCVDLSSAALALRCKLRHHLLSVLFKGGYNTSFSCKWCWRSVHLRQYTEEEDWHEVR